MTAGRPMPTQDDVLGYFGTLSNWGRWGDDDERGTLNHVTDAVRLAAARAVRYFQDFVKPARRYRAADAREAAALADLRDRLRAWEGAADAEALQNMVFEVGKAHGFEPLRAWFGALYEVLLGETQGPRFGGFIALYGVPETAALIDTALDGRLAVA